MEDCYSTKVSEVDGKTIGLFGVFDGRPRIICTSFPLVLLESYLSTGTLFVLNVHRFRTAFQACLEFVKKCVA